MKKWHLLPLAVLICAFAFLVGVVGDVSAAPAAPADLTLTQPDGTAFTAHRWGDEWQNGFETEAGYTILQDGDDWWVYATVASDGALSSSTVEGNGRLLVGVDSPEGLPQHIRPTQAVEEDPGSLHTTNIGSQPVLVLLASFSDRNGTYTAANFQSRVFGSSNSVKDYYLNASFNNLTLTPATETHGTANDGIVGWLNLGYAHPNTADNTDNDNQLIVKNALIAANPYINYANYDKNGDGYISINELHIIVVVAGYETSCGSKTPAVWGHRWSLNNVTPPTLDGKVLGQYPYGGYAQFGEIHEIQGDHQATIGIMVHELGHDLTWPDLYDIDYSSEGVGNWSIMSGGSWNYSSGYMGSSPALPSAWEKWYQGWITPTQVTGSITSASIGQAETNAKAYLLGNNPSGVDWNFYTQSGTGEFFLVENRQLTGYDAGLPGCGLLIWHIDESVTYSNSANANENRPLVKLMEADGLNELYDGYDRGDTGDPFPGLTNKVTFNFSSTPNSRLYSGADSLVSVTGISSCSAAMTANLSYGAYSLTVISPHGTVTRSPDYTSYAFGTAVTLTMNSVDTGWLFSGWSGAGCSGTGACTVTMTGNTTVTANFTVDPAMFTERLYVPLITK